MSKNDKSQTIKPSTKFTSERQPSGKAKSAGRDRRKQRQRMMDKLIEYSYMSIEDLQRLMKGAIDNPDSIQLQDAILLKYAQEAFKDKKMMLDYINRHVPYAPKEIEMSGKDGGPITYNNELSPEQQQALEALQSNDND